MLKHTALSMLRVDKLYIRSERVIIQILIQAGTEPGMRMP